MATDRARREVTPGNTASVCTDDVATSERSGGGGVPKSVGVGRQNMTKINSAEWARRELPVHLAHRLWDFHRLPFVTLSSLPMRACYDRYCVSFERLLKASPIVDRPTAKALLDDLKTDGTHEAVLGIRGSLALCK